MKFVKKIQESELSNFDATRTKILTRICNFETANKRCDVLPDVQLFFLELHKQ